MIRIFGRHCIELLDALLPEGPVIRLVDRDGNIETAYTSDENELDVPMAVVCNGSTASAAELFTAALKDYNKATIVGTTTYGKGCMQTMTELPFGGIARIRFNGYDLNRLLGPVPPRYFSANIAIFSRRAPLRRVVSNIYP